MAATIPVYVFNHNSRNENEGEGCYLYLRFSVNIPAEAPETLVTWKGDFPVSTEIGKEDKKSIRLYFHGNGLCLLYFPDKEKLIDIQMENAMQPLARINAKCLNDFPNLRYIRDTMSWSIQGEVSALVNFKYLSILQLSGMWGNLSEMLQDFSNITELSLSNSSVTGNLNKALKGANKLGELMLESNDITFSVNGDGTSGLYKLYCRHSPNVSGDLGNTHLLTVKSDKYNVFSWEADRDTSLVPMTMINVYLKTIDDAKRMIKSQCKCKAGKDISINISTIDQVLDITDEEAQTAIKVLTKRGVNTLIINGKVHIPEPSTEENNNS